MSKKGEKEQPPAGCTDCDKVELEKKLEAQAEEAAFERDLQKLDRQGQIDIAKLDREHANALDLAEDAAATELQKSNWQTDFELSKLFHEKLAEVSAGSIERARDSAKYIQTAAAWIATLYSGLLALVFSVTDNPLPLRGVYAAIFLGLAVALAAGYLAFITKPSRVLPSEEGGGSLEEKQMNRSDYLIRWVNSSVQSRRWAIRASVVSLAVGVAFIPAAFVASSRPATVPDPPEVPAIPAVIADAVGGDATKLFQGQIRSYEAAQKARNEAVAKSAMEAKSISSNEAETNQIALVLAAAGLFLVLLGPWTWGLLRD